MLQQVSTSHTTLLASMNAFTAEGEKALARMQHNYSVTGEHLDQVASAMDNAGQELSASCQSFVENVVGGLSQALGMFEKNMTALMSTLSDKIDSLNSSGTSAETAAATAEMQKLLTELKQALPEKEV